MVALIRHTKVYRILTVYQYFAINLPKVTTTIGIGLLLGIVAVHLYVMLTADVPAYLVVYFLLLIAGSLTALVMMTFGARRGATRRGWWIGSTTATVLVVLYLLSRFTGLPGSPEVKGWWDFGPGTIALALAAGFLGLHLSVLLGVSVAYPQKRTWHD
jgi:hypothetical protein